ncbi:MAG: AzlC family ABC transporter permease [Lachnospiraceae bacterium]|nr:AzlC family ABC transporter permease [Lachnospiraceae bacterium]
MKDYKKGLKAGIPIGLGYFSVSFTFGIMAHSMGFYWWQATLISILVVTSAGQFQAIKTMLYPGQYLEMIISQLTINIRYSFMSISLGQKTEEKFKGIYKWLLGFFVTDEIFAVAVMEKEVTRAFFAGLATIPWIGWTIGTMIGALLGNVLPESVLSALGLAIYSMFVAIVIPDVKKYKSVAIVVIIAAFISILLTYVPVLKSIPKGFAVSIAAIISAGIGAMLFPLKAEEEAEVKEETRG